MLRVGLVSLGLVAPLAQASAAPVAGHDYDMLPGAHTASTPAGRVEITEFFWYGCPHCAEFEPSFEAWAKREGDKIVLKRVPVPMSSAFTPHSRMYYTLSALGASERLMPVLFDAIAGHGEPLLTPEAQADFLAKYGIDKTQYLQVYKSMRIQADVSRAAKLIRHERIYGVPTVVVGGQYETGPGYTGDTKTTTAVLDYLVDRVR